MAVIKSNWDVNFQDMVVTSEWSAALAKEIDKEIVEEMALFSLLTDGWTEPNFVYSKSNPDIGAWVHTTIRGEYRNLNGKWIFKDPLDATIFTLRWL